MAYVVEIHGIVIKCDTAKDALHLAQEAGRQNHDVHRNGRAPAPRAQKDSDALRRFLSHIRTGGEQGIEAGNLARALNIRAAKGLGGFVGRLNQACFALHVEPKEVVERKKVKGKRMYFARPKLDELLKRI